MMICWDMAFPELARALKLKGADLLIASAAWETPEDHSYEQFARSRALDNCTPLVASNWHGKTKDFEFFGKPLILSCEAKPVGVDAGWYTIADVDLAEGKRLSESFYSMVDERRTDVY